MKQIPPKNSKQEILEGTFDYLVKHGLENIRIRALCKHLGLTQNSLYYWFENKDDLIDKAAIYGLQKVSDDIFKCIFENIDNINEFFEYSLSKIDEYKNELRSIYQMAASPVYGDGLRAASHFTPIYDKYAKLLAKHIGCEWTKIQPIVYLFAASVLDYAIWEDKAEVKTQLDFISSYIKTQMTI